MNSRAVRSSPVGRIKEGEKNFCCVTTRGRKLWVLNGLGRHLGSLASLLLGPSVLSSDPSVLSAFGLPPSCLPATNFTLAFWILAVALIPAARHVLAPTPLAQATPPAESAHSGQAAVFWRNVKVAHGSCNSQGKSSGRMCLHSPRALSRRELVNCYPV